MRFSLEAKLKVCVPRLAFLVAVCLGTLNAVAAQVAPGTATTSTQFSQAVGAIKSIQGDSITVAPDAGGEVTAKLSDSTRILRVPPGQKDLKNATPLQIQDLQPGDRVLVRGKPATDGSPMTALAVIVMKQSDVAAKQEHEREDWQKRGVGGLVTAVDTAGGTITISSTGLGGSHNIAIRTTKQTVLRRYAPNSVKFDDARVAPLDQIKAGDQLRARGMRSADGGELAAEEIVSGSFRNIAGTVTAVDAAANSITVQDAITKHPVTVKISSDSQMKKLPAEMAQRIGMRLKAASAAGGGQGSGVPGSAAPGVAASGGASAGATPQGSNPQRPAWPGAGSQGAAPTPAGAGWQGSRGAGGGENGNGSNGPPDLQRILSRVPASTLADLQKGDAVMIVSTDSGDSGAVTAITLLSGVEPILTATSSRAASTLLSPWTLGSSNAEAAAEQ